MKRVLAGIIFGLLVISNSMLYAKKIDDSAALNGVKEIKSVFLIDFTNIKKTAFYLNIIEGTYKGLVNQDVKPKIVLVFIGETVKYLSTKQEESFEMEYEEELNSIKKSVENFAKWGVRMEVCAVATKVFNVKNEDIYKEMDIVADGFISLMGWQTQDYKLVPIF